MDRLRIVLTVLVIAHHVAIAYGGSGSWYWREEPNASQPLLLMFNAVNQSFFMGFFFLLAGYYTPPSFERKGTARFLADRAVRLGVPLLVYFFLLHPLTVALARTGSGKPLWSGWWDAIRRGTFGPGPLWFAEALLLFAGGYVIWRKTRRNPVVIDQLPGVPVLAALALLLAGLAFLVRLWLPVGREVAWLQLGYFPCYVFLFAAGCASSRSRLLERITFHQARPWLIVTLLALATLPIAVYFRRGAGAFEGGWNGNAVYYALWDPLVAWGVILAALWASRAYASRATALTGWFAGNAYGAFILHPPVAVATSLLLATWALPPLAKFPFATTVACLVSFGLASLLRLVPGTRRVL